MEIIEQLTQTKEKTLGYFKLSDGELSKSYGPGKWTIKEILHHLADAETVLYDRIRRIISEPRQVIWAFDQDLWCQELDYKNMPLEINERIYSATRDSIIHLTERFYQSRGSKEYIHSETGLRTLKNEIDKVVLHNQNHLEQIEKALKNY